MWAMLSLWGEGRVRGNGCPELEMGSSKFHAALKSRQQVRNSAPASSGGVPPPRRNGSRGETPPLTRRRDARATLSPALRPSLLDAVTVHRPGLESIAEHPAARGQAAIFPQHFHRFVAGEAFERESGGGVTAPHRYREEIGGALMLLQHHRARDLRVRWRDVDALEPKS